MKPPTRSIHVFGLAGAVEHPKLHAQTLGVLGLNSRSRSGAEKFLQALVGETLNHLPSVSHSDTEVQASRIDDGTGGVIDPTLRKEAAKDGAPGTRQKTGTLRDNRSYNSRIHNMPSIEYNLFRAKFIKPSQSSLFQDDLTPSLMFLRAVEERPSSELRTGYLWHIGNIRLFSADTGYFAIGRTTKATIEKFDETSGDFLEEELETSPYTHCVFNAQIGLIGIARKATLAQTTKGIANRIKQLLSSSPVIADSQVSVEIVPIPDPEDFLASLNDAYAVSKFSATFRGPNPFDADEHFQKPLSVYLSSANGEKGKAQIQGEDLNREVLQAVTRSTAATGNEASARIRKTKSQKSTTINLRGDPIKRRYDEEEHKPNEVLKDLTTIYYQVRNEPS